MILSSLQLARLCKRMTEATGYLELGMAEQALDRLTGLGELGPLEGEVELIRGEALRCQRRYEDAANSFEKAIRNGPAPRKRTAWLGLSLCYRQAGDTARAIQSLAHARGVLAEKPKPPH